MASNHSRKGSTSRRAFMGATAGAIVAPRVARAQSKAGGEALAKINSSLMVTPDTAMDWNVFKAKGGPTYAGSTGWKRYTDFLVDKMHEYGAVDFDTVDIPYDHYIVEDWPDRRTHEPNFEGAVEKLVSDGTPVPVIAGFGMTSGFTPPNGVSAQMLYFDASKPPAEADIAGKILVFETAKQPPPPYNDFFLDNFTLTDYEWRSPGKWHPLFTPPPTSITSSYHSRWVWSQVNGFAAKAIAGKAAGVVVVYDLSPGAAFGLTQRSVYTPDAKAGLGATYVNCPTLTLDRVNGAKVLADAKAGKRATLTLKARFQRDTGKAFLAWLPGAHYGTERDEQVLLATHTDAMSLIEENGGLGMISIMKYFNGIARESRPRTIAFYFDCRHFMPGGEASWPQFDYFDMHEAKKKKIVATVGMEHLGGRQTIETGPDGNTYAYSSEKPEDGGVITSLFDVYNNNLALVDIIARAATDNKWPRVDVKAGPIAPGVNGGLQGRVKSPMNKGRDYELPGVGLAGDWPGAWTQSFAQIDTEAGALGFDKDYFVQQVAGLSQITGDLMRADPKVIDLGWGNLRSALLNLKDDQFAARAEAGAHRKELVGQYVAAFREVEKGAKAQARDALKSLAAGVAARVGEAERGKVAKLIEAQSAKLA